MNAFSTATKQTTPFVFFKANVIEAAGVSVEQAQPFAARIAKAFDMGEPVWMVADEIKLRVIMAPHPSKSPREVAKAVYRAFDDVIRRIA